MNLSVDDGHWHGKPRPCGYHRRAVTTIDDVMEPPRTSLLTMGTSRVNHVSMATTEGL